MDEFDFKNTTEYQQGLKVLFEKYPPETHKKIEEIYQFSPALAHTIVANILFEAWVQKTPHLSVQEKEIATLAALIGIGTSPDEIKTHTINALKVGVSKEKIIELLILMTAYASIANVFNIILLVKHTIAEFEKSK